MKPEFYNLGAEVRPNPPEGNEGGGNEDRDRGMIELRRTMF